MGVISVLGKVVLIAVNAAMLLIGLVCIVAGILILSGSDLYSSLKSTLEDELQSAAASAGISNLDTSNLSLSEFTEPLGYMLIGLGVLVAGIALLGLIGSCCTIKLVLIVYTIVTAVMFSAQLVFAIIVYADKAAFDDAVKPYLRDTMEDFAGIEGTDVQSLMWNALMNYKDCCGVDDYNDFHDDALTKWPPPTIGGYTFADQKTPIMCCKVKTSAPYACAERATATDSNNNQNTGCYDKLYDMIMDEPVIISAFIIILVLQAVCIFFSIWILCTMNNKIDII